MRSPRVAAVEQRGPGADAGHPGAGQHADTPPAAGPALQPGAQVTPKTQAPNEARVLSTAFASVARALRPSVVRIDVEIGASRVAQNGDDDEQMAPFLRRFFQFGPGMPEPSPGPQRGTGSGVIMDGRGDVVTNRHVVSGATQVKVTFTDGREFTAKTLGMDSETDVAVIRLDNPPRDLVAARLGDSDALEVGEWVLAVGSPLGLDQTVTAGIVSGKGKVGRHVQMSGGRVRRYIQTDAKINPGNSGGPAGEPVGRGGRHQHAHQHRPGWRVRLRDSHQPGPARGRVADQGRARALRVPRRAGGRPERGRGRRQGAAGRHAARW